MKKILLFAFSIFALAVAFNACEEAEDPFYTGVDCNFISAVVLGVPCPVSDIPEVSLS